MNPTILSWIAEIGAGVLAGALIVRFSRWLDQCPECRSKTGPKAVSWRDTAHEHVVQYECRRCSHKWEGRQRFGD